MVRSFSAIQIVQKSHPEPNYALFHLSRIYDFSSFVAFLLGIISTRGGVIGSRASIILVKLK